jgi:hypothetical protein
LNSGSNRQRPIAMMKNATAHSEAFGDDDQGQDHQRGVHGGVGARHPAQLAHDDDPLRRKADLGNGCHGSADHDARQPGVEQADALNIRARQHRAEGAAEDIGRAEHEHRLRVGGAARAAQRVGLELVVKHEPGCDIRAAHQGQETPPPRQRI